MCLFNEAMPAVTLTGTHVAHISLWLLLLQLSKDNAIFIFERVIRGHHIYKKGLHSYDRRNPWFGTRAGK